MSDQDWSLRLADSLGATVDASLVPRLPHIDMSDSEQSTFLHLAHSLVAADLNGDPDA